jgi:hypothetical protein
VSDNYLGIQNNKKLHFVTKSFTPLSCAQFSFYSSDFLEQDDKEKIPKISMPCPMPGSVTKKQS